MAKTEFGEHLRREREMRGVSLDEITAATRIGTRFLEAIESEQWDRLPGGVFNRGFVRAVARFLGLDEEDLIAEYEVATGEPISAHPLPALRGRSAPVGGKRRVTLVALLVMGATALLWLGHRYHTARLPSPAAPSQAVLARPRVRSFPSLANAALDSLIAPRSSPPASGAGNPASARKPPGEAPLELTISAGKPTTVRIIADGKSVFGSKMAAGETQHFQAQKRFIVWARDSGAVRLELNGQTVAPLGLVGRPGKVCLTEKGPQRMAGGF